MVCPTPLCCRLLISASAHIEQLLRITECLYIRLRLLKLRRQRLDLLDLVVNRLNPLGDFLQVHRLREHIGDRIGYDILRRGKQRRGDQYGESEDRFYVSRLFLNAKSRRGGSEGDAIDLPLRQRNLEQPQMRRVVHFPARSAAVH